MVQSSTRSLLALTLICAGCSTHYQPRPGPRVSMVMEGGSLAYHRNGETIQHGFFGGGLVEAVESDPAAVEAAEIYEGRLIGGFVAQIVGLACFAAGTGWALSEENDTTQGTILLGSLGCLLAGTITGTVLLTSAQPYHFDAINIYNDNKQLGVYPMPPPYAPPYTPANPGPIPPPSPGGPGAAPPP
jgi:hypothetical protein